MHPLKCVLILTVVKIAYLDSCQVLERNVAITSDEDLHEQVDNGSKDQCMNVSLVELFQGASDIRTGGLCEGDCVDGLSNLLCVCKLNGSALETRVGHLFIDFGQRILDFYHKTSSDLVPKYAEHFDVMTIYSEIIEFIWFGRCQSECQFAFSKLDRGNPPGECTCKIGEDEEKELTFARYIFQTGQMLLSFKP